MNRYKLNHLTAFDYDGPVSESYNEVRLRPLQDDLQSCLSFTINTFPHASLSTHFDFFGNWVHEFNIIGEHRHLRIETESVVLVLAPPAPQSDGISFDELPRLRDALEEDFYDLMAPTGYVPHLPDIQPIIQAARAKSGGSALGFVESATELIHNRFRYEKGATHVASSILDALGQNAGVCQDFAHLLLAAARMAGLPARYVSGYLVPRRTAEPGASIEEVIGGQASHAWAEVYIPELGWIPQDPTLGQPVGLRHVRIAYGRDYGDVAPVRGVYKGHSGQRLSVDVRVRPALDDEGCERLMETAAGPLQPPPETAPPQQQQQQQ